MCSMSFEGGGGEETFDATGPTENGSSRKKHRVETVNQEEKQLELAKRKADLLLLF